MTDILSNLMLGLSVALSPNVLIYAVVGCIVGTLVGVLPGLGPLAGISLLLPLSFGLPPTTAVVLLAGIYYGAMYGGSTTSILMRIPGESASVITCIDGYEMARNGRAGPALPISAIGSFVAGTISVFLLMLIAPQIARFALKFGPAEFVGLLTLGLLALSQLSSGSRLRALLMSLVGLALGMIGIDPMSGYARFTFEIPALADGLGIVPLAVGGFGISEILLSVGVKRPPTIKTPRLRELLPNGEESHHLFVRLLCRRTPDLQAPRAIRQGRCGRRRRPGISEQRGGQQRLCSHAGARPAHRRHSGGNACGADDPRRLPGPQSH
jgi:putative tricarboxylic transport membrane protein